MYRTERDTGKWFVADHKPEIKDREFAKNQSPGLYDSVEKLNANPKSISWNLGKVPFKSCEQRFKNDDYKMKGQPGPGQYHTVMGMKPQSSPISTSNPQLNMSSAFKSKVPKTTIYLAEEKRIKQLYGEK